MGKNIGDDLLEGKTTLPLIYAMEKGDHLQSEIIKKVLLDKNVSDKELDRVLQIVSESGALEYTRELAQQQANEAIACLESIEGSTFRDALMSMAEFSIRRNN